jgi:hypothetical protein
VTLLLGGQPGNRALTPGRDNGVGTVTLLLGGQPGNCALTPGRDNGCSVAPNLPHLHSSPTSFLSNGYRKVFRSVYRRGSGVWGSVVVNALRYRSDGLWIDPQCGHWGFSPQLPTEPCALGSTQPLKMSTRIFLGLKTAGA